MLTLAALIAFDRVRRPAIPAQVASEAAAQQKPEPPPTLHRVPEPATTTPELPPTAAPQPAPDSLPKIDLEALAQRVAPAVFRLEVKDRAGNVTSTGTAFAISADGLAVTNFHVVEAGESFTARTTQGAEFTVTAVTATDPSADLALITLKAGNLSFLDLGESDAVKIGAPVAVFGAPHGLSGTLSEGILSARRTKADLTEVEAANGGNLLQITAPISPGSSGSPVFDHDGKVIGVAAAA